MVKNDKKSDKLKSTPIRWGRQTADFYTALEGKHVTVALVTGKALKGELVGVDQYDIILRQSSGLDVLVGKGSIAYVHPSPAEG